MAASDSAGLYPGVAVNVGIVPAAAFAVAD